MLDKKNFFLISHIALFLNNMSLLELICSIYWNIIFLLFFKKFQLFTFTGRFWWSFGGKRCSNWYCVLRYAVCSRAPWCLYQSLFLSGLDTRENSEIQNLNFIFTVYKISVYDKKVVIYVALKLLIHNFSLY